MGSSGGQVVKNPPCNAADRSLIPGPGRSLTPRGDWARGHKRSPRSERPHVCGRGASSPRSQIKPKHSNKTHHSQEIKRVSKQILKLRNKDQRTENEQRTESEQRQKALLGKASRDWQTYD